MASASGAILSISHTVRRIYQLTEQHVGRNRLRKLGKLVCSGASTTAGAFRWPDPSAYGCSAKLGRRRLLPSAAQCFVELDYAHKFGVSNLGQPQLGLKKITIGIERVQLRIQAAVIADVCQALAILKSGDKFILFEAACTGPLMGDQRIGNLPESGRDRSLIGNLRLVALSLCQTHAGLDTARCEDGLRDLRDKGPCVGGPGEELRQTGGLAFPFPPPGDLRGGAPPGAPQYPLCRDPNPVLLWHI